MAAAPGAKLDGHGPTESEASRERRLSRTSQQDALSRQDGPASSALSRGLTMPDTPSPFFPVIARSCLVILSSPGGDDGRSIPPPAPESAPRIIPRNRLL